ncbi:MAG: MOFRL family protein, partial [Pyrinomonadaceae bacterium]
SDTNPGEEANVASGPTLTPLTGSQTASEIVRLYGLGAFLPRSILRSIEQDERSLPPAVASGFHLSHPHCVLLDNHTATEAAASKARELGFVTEVADDIREQPIAEGCSLLLNRLDELHERADKEQAICLISGGEFSCPTRGDGFGGRNLETVLRCAIKLHESKQTSTRVVLSAGTDGIDGNSPAAGAIADKTTISRAAAAGLDAWNFLDRSDSFTFLDTLGDAIFTGATGTNVRDIRILLASPSY